MDHYLTSIEEMDAALMRLLDLGLIEFRNGGYAITEKCVAINAGQLNGCRHEPCECD